MGREQDGQRFAVVIQNDDFLLSTTIICLTSSSALPSSFRPEVLVLGQKTRVLTEQVSVVSPDRLGQQVGRLSLQDMLAIESALKTVMGFLK